jgi:hypothetical protein
MIDSAQKRGEIIKHLEDALACRTNLRTERLATFERALDEARSRQFRLSVGRLALRQWRTRNRNDAGSRSI